MIPVTNGFAARALLGGEIPTDGALRRVGNHGISAEVAVETAGAAAADLEVLSGRAFDEEEETEGEEEESEGKLREGIEIPRQSNFVHLIPSFNIDRSPRLLLLLPSRIRFGDAERENLLCFSFILCSVYQLKKIGPLKSCH